LSQRKYYPKKADDEDVVNPQMAIVVNNTKKVYVAPSSQDIHFYVSGEIGSPEDYIDWFHIIRNAGENDTITIHINSNGGVLSTAIQFMRVLRESDATVTTSVEGDCMSAATLLFLCGDNVEISEHSMFMFHNYSGGLVGKGGEIHDAATYERKWSENLWKSEYKDFLTETEIASMLDGKDLWMDGDEVLRRLNKKSKAILKEIKKKKATEEKTE